MAGPVAVAQLEVSQLSATGGGDERSDPSAVDVAGPQLCVRACTPAAFRTAVLAVVRARSIAVRTLAGLCVALDDRHGFSAALRARSRLDARTDSVSSAPPAWATAEPPSVSTINRG